MCSGIILGCTNPFATNYNPQATENDGSCIVPGCTDIDADNYYSGANQDDGSCVLLISSEKGLRKYELQPMAKIISSAVIGVEPRIMGIGPVLAAEKALEKANLKMKDMDIIE